MSEWWDGLSAINRGFYMAAVFFGVFFVWQLVAALLGLADDGTDADVDIGGDEFELEDAVDDGADTMLAFKLLSIRSILTFCTLFFWGTALYLNRGDTLGRAMGVSVIWGLAGMGCVGFLLAWLPKLADTGNKDISSCVGLDGTVYLDIPEGGRGEIRVLVSGVVSYVGASCSTGEALKAGTPIVVEKALDSSHVMVRSLVEKNKGGTDSE